MKGIFRKLTPENGAVLKLTAEIDRRIAEIEQRGVKFLFTIGTLDYTISATFLCGNRLYTHDSRVQFKGRKELDFWAAVQWNVEYCLDVVTELALKADLRCEGR